ncbi:ABC transporter C family member 2, putative [Plasmodium gallinaceum]|uniref:Multidrug resistance-associated protein 2, putative n=1 Tax=Plasmodium gallinaceum TaxID=5849 RepID=A0A1J1GMN5_PLAGA|nr:ABC transporter C family member 2, putative [Plasmodium gallinaceum]CRG93595.1 ABC transporter C family member 2, putative [Plasmodium gallinaceum]
MVIHEKKTKNIDTKNEGCLVKNISWINFVTFNWMTKLLDSLKNEDFKLPNIEENVNVKYYTHKLGENLRNVSIKKSGLFNNLYRKGNSYTYVKYPIKSKRTRSSEYYIHYNNISWALLKTFKFPLGVISLFHIFHTLFLIFVALCVEKYVLLIKGSSHSSIPPFFSDSRIAYGIVVISILCFGQIFDAVLCYYDYRLRVDMEITVMHFLYNINLRNYNNNLMDPYTYMNIDDDDDDEKTNTSYCKFQNKNLNKEEKSNYTDNSYDGALYNDSHHHKKEKIDSHKDLYLNTKDYYSICYNNEIYVSDQHINNNNNDFVRTSSNTRTYDREDDTINEANKEISNNFKDIKGSYENENEKDDLNLKKEKITDTEKDNLDEKVLNSNNNEWYPEKGNNYKVLANNENLFKENEDKLSCDNNVKLSEKKKNKKKKSEKEVFDLNIYNIMFVDTPYLIYFLSSVIDLSNMVIKFVISFYMFSFKMGGNTTLSGALMIIFLYGIMLLFEFSSSLFKKRYLKYRDTRIGNMHHVLKEYKLMKIFNWESIAFDYVNYFRKKEMRICRIRIFLSSLSNYINNISGSVVEVVLFFLFIKSELEKNKTVNFSSIITPLFIYKSLISDISNFPNIMNNLIEGVINIKRINKYVYYYLYYNDINNYFKYFSSNNNTSTNLLIEDFPKNEAKSDLLCNKNCNEEKKKTRNFFRFLFFNKSKKTNPIENETLNNLNYDTNSIKKVKYSNDALNCTENYSSIYLEKKNKTRKREDDIIKLENCFFTPNKKIDNMNDDFLLKNVNFNLKNNTLSIIIGNVGSGKTVFFQSILGDFKLAYGNFYVKNILHNMPILYVPQYNWVSVGTVRSMILFGNEYDASIYYHVISQSELLNDLISFKNKDMRFVNDEHNLSKGQKARICLARALYHHYTHMKELSINYEKEINENNKLKKNMNSEKFYQFNTKDSINNTTEKSAFVHNKDVVNKEDNQKYNCEQNNSVNYSNNNTNILQNSLNVTNNSCDHGSTLNVYYNNNINNINNNSSNEEDIFNKNYVKNCLKNENISYLYLMDDFFSGLDPCISKDIFYNLFCHKEEIECFKNNCSYILSMNENIFETFIIDDILKNLQYKVDIYKIENNLLKYEGEISEYIKKNNINVKVESYVNKKKLNVEDTKLKLCSNQEGYNKKQSDMKYNKFILLKQLKTMYSFKISESNSFTQCSKNDTINTHKVLESEFLIDDSKNISNNSVSISIKEDNFKELYEKKKESYLNEFEEVMKSLPSKLKSDNTIDNVTETEDELKFKGNIKLETFSWYLSKVGFPLISVIVIFMLISIFTEEIKNLILFMASTILKNKKESNNEILNKQMIYLRYFILLPSISLVTTLTCFMLIAHGVIVSAIKVHTEVLMNILYAPIHVFYSNNLGNIINRFITDVNVLDNGIIKRIYKTFYTFFRFIFTTFLLIYMIKHTLLVFPFILLIIYFVVFKRYSKGCKEAQRGYLSSHAPLCNMYSNTILGKNIINLYKKNDYFLNIYKERTWIFRNYTIFKWSITIWASLYVQLIVLLLTLFYIIYPHLFLRNTNSADKGRFDKSANVVGYCITFSCSLGYIIKGLLYDYTHVEKEMCSTQRLEECSKMITEKESTEGTGRETFSKINTQKKSENIHNFSDITKKSDVLSNIDNIYSIDESKKKYGIHFEKVFVSYKKKIYIDKKNNIYNYVNEKSCLKNINIYALKNQNIGIVGKSGSGKSTMILSILGLIPTTGGKITIEGRDITEINMDEKKNIIGVLPQSSFVFFNWNVRTFIDPYKNFKDEEIVDAFKLIGINLSYKDLDKYIYKQRKKRTHSGIKKKSIDLNNFIPLTDDCIRYLSVVRLFLNRHKYKLVLIDEIPVINANNNNMKISKFFTKDLKSFDYIIRNYFENTTVFIIAHDTSTLSCCDFIYVIQKGEVVYRCRYKDIKTQAELANILEKNN